MTWRKIGANRFFTVQGSDCDPMRRQHGANLPIVEEHKSFERMAHDQQHFDAVGKAIGQKPDDPKAQMDKIGGMEHRRKRKRGVCPTTEPSFGARLRPPMRPRSRQAESKTAIASGPPAADRSQRPQAGRR
jgi:hypothetical protein